MSTADRPPGHRTYADFNVDIHQVPESNQETPISYLVLIESRAGEAKFSMHLPYDQQDRSERLHSLENAMLRYSQPLNRELGPGHSPDGSLANDARLAQDFGRALFDAMLGEQGRRLYYQSLLDAEHEGMGLRLKLRIDAGEPAKLPWEFLYDPEIADYIALAPRTTVVRDVWLAKAKAPITVSGPLRILGMVANPRRQAQLETEHEKAQINQAMSSLLESGNAELEWVEGQTWEALKTAIQSRTFHVFHFIGHGDNEQIMLTGPEGNPRPLRAELLAKLLTGQAGVRLVVLNSCEGARGGAVDPFSSTASNLIRRGIPAVLAMQYKISDPAAITFARHFYEALARNNPIDRAVGWGRFAMNERDEQSYEWATPVLYQRAPDGMLFNITGTSIAFTPFPLARTALPKGRDVPADIPSARQRIDALAETYNQIRDEMPRGTPRDRKVDTTVVAEIQELIKGLGPTGVEMLPDLTVSQNPGERLAATIILRFSPKPEYISWLGNRFFKEQNYVGRHAAIALVEAVRALYASHGDELHHAIAHGKQSLEDRYRDPDRIAAKHRYQILLDAELELRQLRERSSLHVTSLVEDDILTGLVRPINDAASTTDM